MNQHAVALAADSAVTTTQLIRGQWETRYSKGGNKIFQLSHHDPVAAMIYGSASLQNIPWELVLKAYRDELGSTNYPTLPEYIDGFFTWLRACQHLFPTTKRQADYKTMLTDTAYSLLREARDTYGNLEDVAQPLPQRQADWATFVTAVRARLATAPPIFPGGNPQRLQAALAQEVAQLSVDLTQNLGALPIVAALNMAEVAELAIETSYRTYQRALTKPTGIVFAGYGKTEYFPSYQEFMCYGFFEDTIVLEHDNVVRITEQTPSAIRAFAKTSAVDTFMLGFGWELLEILKDEYETASRQLVTDVITAIGAQAPADLGARVTSSHDGFRQAWRERMFHDHYWPLKAVISGLPVDEMAELAETLVMLESLKEKVSASTTSVSGPFDVALITKAEGLVWIKRKLFFDPAKNPRYFLRQKNKYQNY